MAGKYSKLSDEEVVEELRKRIVRMKKLLIEIRDIFREMR